jgi:membrane protein YqaA with SNARE-associated domain
VTLAAARRPFARLEAIARGRSGLLLVGGWGFAEAVLFPVVPDVALGLLVLVAPGRLPALFATLVAGALAGSACMYAASLAAPDAVAGALLALPAIPPSLLAEARAAVADGGFLSMTLQPPGTPLKVYTWAWAVDANGPVGIVGAIVVNRIVRILPAALVLAIVGRVAPGLLRRFDRLVLVAYAVFYVIAYAVYWS